MAIDPPKKSTCHLGLVGIKERAEFIGGQFHIRSFPGEGTTIKVLVRL
jgi:signal transduction histidine kinase